jgi:hypothetical protein
MDSFVSFLFDRYRVSQVQLYFIDVFTVLQGFP